MISRFIHLLLKFSPIVVIGVLFAAVFFSFYATEIQFDPSFNSLISSDTQYNTNERLLANQLGNQDVFLIIVKPDDATFLTNHIVDLNRSDVASHLALIRETMLQSQYVTFVSPVEYSGDNSYARISVGVNTPRRTDGFETVIADMQQYFALVDSYPGLAISLTGFPLLLNQVNTLIISDNIKTIALTIIAIFLVLFFYFKSMRLTLITLSVPILSIILLAGMMSYFGIPISITLAIVGILTVGLGVDFAIHLIVSYESYLEQKYSHTESIVRAIKHLYVAIIASFLTTAAGFTALMFGVSPATQGQGIVLTLAISIIAFLTVVYFPCAIYIFGNGKLPPKNRFFNLIKKSLVRLAVLQTKRPKIVLLGVGIITVIMFFGVLQVGFDTSNDNWIPKDDPIQQSFRENSYAFGDDFSSLRLVVQSQDVDLRNVQVVRDMQRLERELLSIPQVEEIVSPYSDLVLDQARIYEEISPNSFNRDFSVVTITIRASSFDSDSTGSSDVLDEIIARVSENTVYKSDISLFGDVLRFRELGISLGRDTGITTLLSFIFVFIIATCLYMSFVVGIVALLPIIIGIIWTLGFMGYLGVPFTSLSTGLIALVLGIGIDFSIHLVNSTRNYLAEGKSIQKAIMQTMSYSGGALLLTSVTTFIGFFSLVLAGLLGIQRLGISLALSIVAVFLVTIIMVPSILSLQYKKK